MDNTDNLINEHVVRFVIFMLTGQQVVCQGGIFVIFPIPEVDVLFSIR